MNITVSTKVAAPIDAVWHADTSPEAIKQWNAVSPDWHTTAATVVQNERIDSIFGEREAHITVVALTGGVEVTMSFDAEQIHSEQQQREGWQAVLDNFRRYVEARSRRAT